MHITHFPSSIPFCEEQNGPLSSPAEEAGEDVLRYLFLK